MPALVLASTSPRRRELLARIGLVPARVAAPEIDEPPLKAELPRDYVAGSRGARRSRSSARRATWSWRATRPLRSAAAPSKNQLTHATHAGGSDFRRGGGTLAVRGSSSSSPQAARP